MRARPQSAPPPLTHLLRGYGTPALPGDNLLIASPPGYAVAPSTKVNLRNVPTRPPSAHRNAPQLPVHIVAAGLTPKPAAYSAAAVTADAACRWSAAWAGIPRATGSAQGHAAAAGAHALRPFRNPVVNELPTREAAGSLARVALKRPAAREAWQEASLERKKTAEEIRRESGRGPPRREALDQLVDTPRAAPDRAQLAAAVALKGRRRRRPERCDEPLRRRLCGGGDGGGE